MHDRTTPRPLVFFHTLPMPCPYLPNRTERRLVADISGRAGSGRHDHLARAGFRRTQTFCYHPACPDCSACVPIRIRTRDFRWSRSFRRVLQRNSDLAASWRDARATAEQFALFRDYQDTRHVESEMSHMNPADFGDMIERSPIQSRMLEYRDPGSGRLVAAMLVDRQDDGFSAVYSFFSASALIRSPGIFMVLDLVERAAAEGLPYVYLGYWIGETPKMSYKARFQPAELLRGGAWAEVDQFGNRHPGPAGRPE